MFVAMFNTFFLVKSTGIYIKIIGESSLKHSLFFFSYPVASTAPWKSEPNNLFLPQQVRSELVQNPEAHTWDTRIVTFLKCLFMPLHALGLITVGCIGWALDFSGKQKRKKTDLKIRFDATAYRVLSKRVLSGKLGGGIGHTSGLNVDRGGKGQKDRGRKSKPYNLCELTVYLWKCS